MVRSRLFSLWCFLLLNSVAFSQCYDLRSTHLYEPQGRFQEWWDKPLWNGQTGNENFHVDEPTWGRARHFALFDLGVVRKTSEGWIPYKTNRKSESWCDPTPERSGVFCYTVPYQKPSPEAKIHTISYAPETWSLDRDGIVHFRYHDPHGIPAKIENFSDYKPLPGEFGLGGYTRTDATLDLNTGDYKFESHGYLNGGYIRRYPSTGAKLWNIDTFQAKATLQEIPCPASAKSAALSPNKHPVEVKLATAETCVAKIKKTKDSDKTSELWEFVQNLDEVASPDNCIQVFESLRPPGPALVPVTQAQSLATTK